MLPLPGLMAMPTVLLNAALSLVRERGIVAVGPDRLAAFAPMFDEEAGAGRAIRSLLEQTEPLDELVLSINGGTDGTPEVVARTLAELGFEAWDGGSRADGHLTRWRKAGCSTAVEVVRYLKPTAKARSLNRAVESGLISAERVLVVDGDTVLSPRFAAEMRRSFYRLRYARTPDGRHGYVLEDSSLQTGAVRSLPGTSLQSRLISAGRDAEYAFSAVVRRGQCARVGDGRLLGRSRLFTVVGCGFVASRETLPMPDDTLTEDHDLTLCAQNAEEREERSTAGDLDVSGHRLLVNGRERPLAAIIGPRTPVTVRRTSTARFVQGAVMRTEDPPRLGGFMRQVERWNGGGLENALKRLAPLRTGKLRANVAFTVASAQVENLVGLFLALLLPALLGVRYALPSVEMPAAVLAAWLGIDVLASLLIVLAGARRLGDPWVRAVLVAVRGVVPLLLMRALGALSYVTAATRVLPTFVASSLKRRSGDVIVYMQRTWTRPRAAVASAVHLRTAGVAASVLLVGLVVFVGFAHLARVYIGSHDTWRYVYGSPRLDQQDFELLPVSDIRPALEVVSSEPPRNAPSHDWVSPYCPPSAVAGWSEGEGDDQRAGLTSDRQYQPLSPWGILMLGRLTPLLTHLEEAALAYGIDPAFLLQVLLNESYLDPLARGPTNDVGLAQLTSDALTLIAAVSSEAGNPLRNEALFAGAASAFDPEFSLCAGAAKLAWAVDQPGGGDPRIAYARYINPFHGVKNGTVASTHLEPVEAMVQLSDLVQLLAAVVEEYRADPARVTPQELQMLVLADEVRGGYLSVRDAYAEVADMISAFRIDDRAFYSAVLNDLYGPGGPDLDVSGQFADARPPR